MFRNYERRNELTNERTYERKSENYIPVGINAGGIMIYHWDKFLHTGAVTIVNNRDHALHYAIEGEIKS